MHRALRRIGLCLWWGTTRGPPSRRVRRQAFIVPPTRRNRLWQVDISVFETLGAGRWNRGGVGATGTDR